ncbi:T9SS type A sorting domain-containing protein [Aequorivita viscosa]|nr:T9SS type A sorting domain-containing protein [Aequorivita viscosa]
MKYLIIIGCFICGISSYSQYTAIPDPNFENYLEQNGMGDGVPGNGQVLTANINTVTELLVNIQNISDLTGIEDFVALELLGCAFNPLTTLDLSNNHQLVELYCTSGNIESLNITQCPNLEILYCDENFLMELDISQNPNLDELSCEWNLLTGLDTTQNPNLGYLFCEHNEIEGYFDTSQNPELIYFTAHDNNITDLDFTQNPFLNSFGGFSNPLENVDVRNGNNANMQTFNVTDSSGLKCILVDDASASYLDDWLKDPGATFVNNQAECDALGVAAATLQGFTMYPNPATSEVILNLPNQGFDGLVVTVTNNLGQVLESKEPLRNKTFIKLDVSGYAAGVYFVTLRAGNDITTKKLVVR